MNLQIINDYAGTDPGLTTAGTDPGRRYKKHWVVIKITHVNTPKLPESASWAVIVSIAVPGSAFSFTEDLNKSTNENNSKHIHNFLFLFLT